MKDVTIIIPTYNRPKLFKDLIKIYTDLDIKSPILIADSSGYSHHTDYKNLDIKIINYPEETDVFDKFADIGNYVETKYCILSADDDRLKWELVKKYKDFLDNNSEYVMAMGQNIAKENISITHDIPEERYLKHFSNYMVTIYGLYRTAVFKQIWNETKDLKFESVWCELYASALVSIHGKIKCFDEYFIDRTKYTNGLSKKCKRLYDYVSDGTYEAMHKRFINGIVNNDIPLYIVKKGWRKYTYHYHWFLRDRFAHIMRR